jgi:hypothetical protein
MTVCRFATTKLLWKDFGPVCVRNDVFRPNLVVLSWKSEKLLLLGVCGILGVKPIHTQVPCEPPILEISRNAFNLIEICYFPSHNVVITRRPADSPVATKKQP